MNLCILLIFSLLISIVYIVLVKRKEDYYDLENDYKKENPNALVSGKNIAGTVYSKYPENSVGLGWIN